MSAHLDFRITTTISDIFDIPKFGVLLIMSVELAIWTQLREDWQPSLLRHDGVSYKVELIDKLRVFLPVPGRQTIGLAIGDIAPRTTFKAGDPVELR